MCAESREALTAKAKALIAQYEAVRTNAHDADADSIKWDAELDRYVRQGITLKYDRKREVEAQFRPFTRNWLYFDTHLNGRTYRLSSMYRAEQINQSISFLGVASQNDLAVQATDLLFDLGFLKAGNGGTAGVTRYRYTKSGDRVDNITDWALAHFRAHYAPASPCRGGIDTTKDDIFAYCYAALHDPVYRRVHADDLRREFPRVPLNADFAAWRDWGRTLLKLHIGYEKVKPFPLDRVDAPDAQGRAPTPKLKSLPKEDKVVVDTATQLTGIPADAWRYRLGNRAAIDWVLDQHKEKKIKDPTVAANFDTYRFADHKETMIALLAKVVRVSVETLAITDAMAALDRGD